MKSLTKTQATQADTLYQRMEEANAALDAQICDANDRLKAFVDELEKELLPFVDRANTFRTAWSEFAEMIAEKIGEGDWADEWRDASDVAEAEVNAPHAIEFETYGLDVPDMPAHEAPHAEETQQENE